MENNAHQFFTTSSPPNHDKSKTEHFVIEDLLDFPTDEAAVAVPFVASTESSPPLETCNSPLPGDVPRRTLPDPQFSNDLCVPVIMTCYFSCHSRTLTF